MADERTDEKDDEMADERTDEKDDEMADERTNERDDVMDIMDHVGNSEAHTGPPGETKHEAKYNF